jgi:adenylyltransferase/sulfurtransferase
MDKNNNHKEKIYLKNKIDEKYSRQVLLLGKEAQEKLRKSKVAVIGIGALGTVASELIVRAGIENILLIDFDKVEESNLQRQSLFTEKDIGKNKALSAKKHLEKINCLANIKAENIKLDEKNILILDRYDLIFGCTDELNSRFLINRYCTKNKIPWIFGSAVKSSGYVFPIIPKKTCLNCFIKKAVVLDKASTVGILNTITYSIPTLMVTLGIKILLGNKVESILYYYNIWDPELKKIKVKQRKDCICTYYE